MGDYDLDRDEDDVGDLIAGTGIALGVGAEVVGVAVPPVGAAIAVAACVASAGHLVRSRIRRRAHVLADGIRDRLPSDEMANLQAKLTTDEDLAVLTAQALDASMLSHHEEQARALGRVLGEALKAEPTVSIDDAAMLIEALRSLDLPHLRVLSMMPERSNDFERAAVSSAIGGADESTVSAVIGGLQRSGLIEVSTSPRLGLVDDSRWFLTAFGKRALSYIDD